MYLWADRTEKFCGGSERMTAAVEGAVVSKPVAKNTTSRSGCSRAMRTASRGL